MKSVTSDVFEEVVGEVLASSNKRRQDTVRRLVKVLEGMRDQGMKVFAISNVGRECEDRKILTTQSIRNTNGEPFRRIIDAFARRYGLATTHAPAQRMTPLEEAIMAINDLDVRIRLLDILAENKALRSQVQRLQAGFKNLTVPNLKIATKSIVNDTVPDVEIIRDTEPLKVNYGPLERFISEEWIDQHAWTIAETGAIKEGADPITPPGFVPALAGIITILQSRR